MIYQGNGKYPVDEVVLHCAAVDGKWHVGKTAKQARDIVDQWHKERKPPFKMIGYHGLIMPNGEFIQGRPYTMQGAHVVERNRGSIGLLMIETKTITKMGRFEDYFTELQRQTVKRIIKCLSGIKHVSGHNDYTNAKLCPGFKVKSEEWMP